MNFDTCHLILGAYTQEGLYGFLVTNPQWEGLTEDAFIKAKS